MPVRKYLTTRAAQDPANSDHTPDLNEARCWLREYLDEHVQDLQEHRQHHIHIMTEDGTRAPLAHCKRLDNPDLCKSDFPHTKWLIERPVILCKCLLHEMDMPASGKKNKLGSLHGPVNHEWLNGTHQRCLQRMVSTPMSNFHIACRLLLTPTVAMGLVWPTRTTTTWS